MASQPDLVTVIEHDRPFDPGPIDEGSVRGTKIFDQDPVALAEETRMARGDHGKIDHLVAARDAADHHLGAAKGNCRRGLGNKKI